MLYNYLIFSMVALSLRIFKKYFVSYYINTLFYVVQTKRFILHERSVLYCRNKVFITMN